MPCHGTGIQHNNQPCPSVREFVGIRVNNKIQLAHRHDADDEIVLSNLLVLNMGSGDINTGHGIQTCHPYVLQRKRKGNIDGKSCHLTE